MTWANPKVTVGGESFEIKAEHVTFTWNADRPYNFGSWAEVLARPKAEGQDGFTARFMACLAEVGEDHGVEVINSAAGGLLILVHPWTAERISAAVRALRLSAQDFELAHSLLAELEGHEMSEALRKGRIPY